MKPDFIHIQNFCLIEEAMIPLADQGLVLIQGKNNDSDSADTNGSGKTTIFKAFSWCGYGATLDGEKANNVVRRGAKKAVVKIGLIDDDGGKWVITRERGKSERLSLDGPNGQVAESKEQIQVAIEKLLGYDFQAFKNTVLFGQSDSSRFANPKTTDAQRKDVLHRILRTSLLKKCEKITRKRLKELESEIAPYREKILTARASMEEHDVGELTKREDDWNKANASRLAEMKEEEATRAIFIAEKTKLVEECAVSIEKISAEVDELSALITGKEGLHQAAKKAHDQHAKIRERQGKERELERSLLESLSQLDGDVCPTCTADLTTPAPAAFISSAVSQLGLSKETSEKLAKLNAMCLEKIKGIEDEINSIRESKAQQSRAREFLGILKEREEAAKRDLAGALKLQKEHQASVFDVSDDSNPWSELREKAQERTDALRLRIEKIQKVISLKENELAHYQFWVRGFSGQGLPSFILDSVMPTLTERTNHYLETLSDGDITMEFSTRTLLKSGEERDKIKMDWVIEGIENATQSTGQERKMEISTDLALMDIAEAREGGCLDLLFLDEVLDGLDASGRSRVMDLLGELRTRRHSIFVISHDPLLADVFEKSITIVKTDKKSRLLEDA